MGDSNERGAIGGADEDDTKKPSTQSVSSVENIPDPKASGAFSQQGGDEKVVSLAGNHKESFMTNWTPNVQILEQLTSMGINKDQAMRALYLTGNNSAEAAIFWIFEKADAESADFSGFENPWPVSIREGFENNAENTCVDYKMVFAVNCSLGMGVGKTAAQVAHAALGLQLFLLENDETYGNQLTRWKEYGETKVVLKADSGEHLNILAAKAQSLKLPNYLVTDAGRTQIPAGSTTVLSIFGPVDMVDQVTRQLKLL